ncbi:MAG: ABC transporter substrate-binding protein [Methylocystis sp.]|jgi:phospholipid transport system substrate-binding protein
MSRTSIILPVIAAVVLALLVSAPARSESADPAASRVNGFYEVLVSTMQQGRQLGLKGRYEKLAPALSKTYDLASMAKTAVGPSWSEFTPEQQRELVKAFTRMTIATYASRFDDFSGEQFDVAQTVDQPNGDKIVKTRIIQSNGKTVALNYLMHKSGAEWKIMDVYLDGAISELATRRSEFGAILKSGGPEGLISSLTRQSDKLLGGGS